MSRTETDREIVDVVRSIGASVHRHEADPDRAVEALGLLRAAEELLAEGTPRLRWYEEGGSGATRARNRELSPFTGSLNVVAPPMEIETTTLEDGRPCLSGRVRLDHLREGPPRSAHGGVMAGLFDELLGAGQRLGGGLPGMTGRLSVRYRRPTPLDADLEFRVWIDDERTRRVVVRGDCRVVNTGSAQPSPVTVDAEAVFLRVDFDGLDEMMQARGDGETPQSAPAPDSAS